MGIALVSLFALVTVVLVSCIVPRLNPGLLALMATLVIGTFLAKLSINELLSCFPTQLFLLLVCMSLIFGVAAQNGSLQVVTKGAIKLIRGKRLLLPLLFFSLAFLFSAMGPGNIASVAVLAPMTISLARQHKISLLLTSIMICTGANAGAFSPFSPTGVVALGLMSKIGLDESLIWVVFGAAAILQSLSAAVAYGIFLLRFKRHRDLQNTTDIVIDKSGIKLDRQQKMTLWLILILLIGVIGFKVTLLVMAVMIAVVMFVLNLGDDEKVMSSLPWSTIMMVTGISLLIGLLDKTGGLDMATSFIAETTSPKMINGVLAFITGVVSAYSSSSGVVMPAFIPLIPGLALKMGVVTIVPMVISVAVGSHMVDVSPLSTLGALCLAAIDSKTERARVFKWLMVWGLSMSVVAGFLAFLVFDLGWLKI